MRRFYFNLAGALGTVPDLTGTELPDESSARAHATVVARELMRNQEWKTHHWRLLVCDAEHRPCFGLLFASVDESMAQYSPEFRASVERLSEDKASLFGAIRDVTMSINQVKATLARADRVPYLAAVSGVKL